MIYYQRVRGLGGHPAIVLLFLALFLISCAEQSYIIVQNFTEVNTTVIVKEPCNLRCVPCQEVSSASPLKKDGCLRNSTELGGCQVNQTIHGITSTFAVIHCKENEVAKYWNNGLCTCEAKVCL